jgi:hypothetical protein
VLFEILAELGVAVVVTLFAATVLLYTRRSLERHPKLASAATPPYWVLLYKSFESSMDVMLGYVWNMFLTALLFQPLLAASSSTEQQESLRYTVFTFVKAALFTALLSYLYLKYLEPRMRNFDALTFRGSLYFVLCASAVDAIAAANAEAIYGFCAYYLTANSSTAVGLVVAWGFTCLASAITVVVVADRLSWQPSSPFDSFVLLSWKLLASFLIWYTLAATLTELPSYQDSSLAGLLATAVFALGGTFVLAVFAASRSTATGADDTGGIQDGGSGSDSYILMPGAGAEREGAADGDGASGL